MDAQKILLGAQEALSVRRVFGEPIHVDGTTVIPAATVRGGGGGGGKGDQDGGAGFGLEARPAGVFVLRGDRVTWKPVIDVNRIVLGGQLVAITALLVLRSLVRLRTAVQPRLSGRDIRAASSDLERDIRLEGA